MRFALPAAVFAVAAVATVLPVRAQGVPQGSYLRSCTDIAYTADMLTAVCPTRDGRQQFTSLANIPMCVGDIANNDGNLTCRYAKMPLQPQSEPPASPGSPAPPGSSAVPGTR